MTKSEISYILENYIVTTCGRIFNKNSHFRNIKSFEKPTLLATFKNFCKRNKLNMEDFERSETGLRNNSGKKLYSFKYYKETIDATEIFPATDSKGYKVVTIKKKSYRFHRIVLAYFTNDIIDRLSNYNNLQVNHKNGIKTDNALHNLEWCTSKQNIKHAWDTSLAKRGKEAIEKQRKKILAKTDISKLFEETHKEYKRSILQKIERRGYDVRQYEFVKTGVKNGRSYGYLRKTSSI